MNATEIFIATGFIATEALSGYFGSVIGKALLENPVAGGIIGVLVPVIGLGIVTFLVQRNEEACI